MTVKTPNRFNLDRTLTFGLIATLLIETAGALYWAGAMDRRIATLETEAVYDRPITTRLARLEEQVIDIRRSLERIESNLSDVEDTIHD